MKKTCFFLSLICAVLARAELTLAPVFTDHMVLQRDLALPVWGHAAPGAPVSIEFRGEKRLAIADATGDWRVRLAPQPARAEPSTLRVASGTEACEISDVLVGEIWLCAGQSNMEWTLAKEAHAAEEIPQAAQPAIRLLNPDYAGKEAGGNPFSAVEVARLSPERFYRGAWTACTPETAARCSALGYYFARHLHAALGVPIGIINLAVGGSPTEAWMPVESLAADPELRALVSGQWLVNPALEAWCLQRAHENLDRAIAAGEIDARSPGHAFKPGFLWAAAIEPLAPFALRGILWYQGESNSLRLDRVHQHERLLPLLVRDWRARWGLGDLPFYYCQLSGIETANYHSECWPEFRDSQRRLLEVIPNSGMVVTADRGDPASVHPRDKLTVATRLAKLALAHTYGRSVVAGGPVPRCARALGKEVRVDFAVDATGLHTSDGERVRGFEIAGASGLFDVAEARVAGSAVMLYSPRVNGAVRVRYNWAPFPRGNLVNAEGWPSSTFELGVGDVNPSTAR